MATFTWTPSVGANLSIRPNVRRVAFGDGYEQRLAFGINTQPQVWSLE
nr:phage tail protein [Oxalobacteraceae bacterium]